ncbi:rna-directed dna polymerase from mobile element jockey- hypothetical protein [Limosa lapponica baueri]|uniref:Rna-directed dna polymerase from mobile element jockey-like n=1 Tax=Limosa lapponica baueri TaxID=1758121 RepID=A0A2I0T813_LIMLA|nr:rna-directed dna polymerase from mobile element jockey- hypothetical protein [Limosa lapponica baueri]
MSPASSRRARRSAQEGKKEDPGNYRLASLTSIHGKVMVQLILETISRHMKDEKVIRRSQHGFTEGKSCLINSINFCDEVTDLVDEGHLQMTFADDTEMGEVADTPEVCAAIPKNLGRLEKLADRKLMKFNKGKYKVLHLRRNDPMYLLKRPWESCWTPMLNMNQ